MHRAHEARFRLRPVARQLGTTARDEDRRRHRQLEQRRPARSLPRGPATPDAPRGSDRGGRQRSSDGSLDALRRLPTVEVLPLGRNAGFAAANNRAVLMVADCVDGAAAPREIFPACAAAALYSRAAFLAAGGFDESFFCYPDDVDLGFPQRGLVRRTRSGPRHRESQGRRGPRSWPHPRRPTPGPGPSTGVRARAEAHDGARRARAIPAPHGAAAT